MRALLSDSFSPQEMGVEASQARVRHYMESRTIGGRDVIDPTGTLREIHGSQVRGVLF